MFMLFHIFINDTKLGSIKYIPYLFFKASCPVLSCVWAIGYKNEYAHKWSVINTNSTPRLYYLFPNKVITKLTTG